MNMSPVEAIDYISQKAARLSGLTIIEAVAFRDAVVCAENYIKNHSAASASRIEQGLKNPSAPELAKRPSVALAPSQQPESDKHK